jgi:polyisoprenoid-binding protein YceI
MSSSTIVTRLTGTYAADPDHSSVGFAVRHMGVSTFRGSFAQLDATVTVADDGTLTLTGSVPAEGISIVSPVDFRNHVLSADFLDAEHHPVIAFESEPARPNDDGTIAVHGRLTARGLTLPVDAAGTWSAPLEDPYGNMRAAIELASVVDRRDFGMTWNAPLPKGGDALGTDLTLTVHLELIGS